MKWKKIASVTECCNIFLLHKKISEKFQFNFFRLAEIFALLLSISTLKLQKTFFVLSLVSLRI